MPVWSRAGQGTSEIAKVDSETEVKIPRQTYVHDSVRGCIQTAGLWVSAWLMCGFFGSRDTSYWQWFVERWLPWMGRWWPWVIISFIVCWIGWTSIIYNYRLKIEQGVKNPPVYKPAEPENGMWQPWTGWRRRRIENAGLRATYQSKFGKGAK